MNSTLERLIQQRSAVEEELMKLHQRCQLHGSADSEQLGVDNEKVSFN